MKLAYCELASGSAEQPAVVLHDRGVASVERVAAVARDTGAVGRVVAPFGDYGYTASGMELAGICWYRTVPGYAGADPISLAKAVVQVGDLIADLLVAEPELTHPVLVGWGQGGVVAVGAALLRTGDVSGAVCIDGPPGHIRALPARLFEAPSAPPVLVMSREELTGGAPGTDSAGSGADSPVVEQLVGRGLRATGWQWPGGSEGEPDKAIAAEIGRWLDDG